MDTLITQIRDRYLQTLEHIAVSARANGRNPESVRLVVVTKAQPLEVVQAVVQAGARLLGENYPEESVSKILSFGPEIGVEWHMIGHVQSRKARLVIEHFDLLQSLDSLKLAERLDRMAAEAGRILPVMLEFNVGATSCSAKRCIAMKSTIEIWTHKRMLRVTPYSEPKTKMPRQSYNTSSSPTTRLTVAASMLTGFLRKMMIRYRAKVSPTGQPVPLWLSVTMSI